jgi:hypothetical protein
MPFIYLHSAQEATGLPSSVEVGREHNLPLIQRGKPLGQRRANHLMRVAAQSAVVVTDWVRTTLKTGLDRTNLGLAKNT